MKMDKKLKNTEPPIWADRFFEWYCNPDMQEEILGDFNVCSDRASTLLARRKQRFAQRVTAKQVVSTAA